MILRRTVEALKQQHWTGVFIELVIVVLGVFIGLQVDNWNQSRIERGSEISYLASLKRDVDFSIKQLEKSQESLDIGESARAALFAYSIDPKATMSDAKRDTLVRDGVFNINGTLHLSQITFQTLKSSGHLDVIKSPQLVSTLQSVSTEAERIRLSQADEGEVTHLVSDPMLIRHFDLLGTFQMPSRPDSHSIAWLPKQYVATPAPAFMKSVRFRNVLLYRSYLSESRLLGIKDLLKLHRTAARQIEARQRELGVQP